MTRCGRPRPFCFLGKRFLGLVRAHLPFFWNFFFQRCGRTYRFCFFFPQNCFKSWCGPTNFFLELFFKGAGAPRGGAGAPTSPIFARKLFNTGAWRTTKWCGRSSEGCGRTVVVCFFLIILFPNHSFSLHFS